MNKIHKYEAKFCLQFAILSLTFLVIVKDKSRNNDKGYFHSFCFPFCYCLFLLPLLLPDGLCRHSSCYWAEFSDQD